MFTGRLVIIIITRVSSQGTLSTKQQVNPRCQLGHHQTRPGRLVVVLLWLPGVLDRLPPRKDAHWAPSHCVGEGV